MQIVINIPDEMYAQIINENGIDTMLIPYTDIIKNGTPLPKGHGRLIDADSLDIPVDICDGFEAMDYIDATVAIIEADKEAEK